MWSSSFSINTTDFFLLNTPKLNTPGKHRLKPYCTLWNAAIANIKDEMSWNKTESHGKSIVSHSGRDYLEGKEIFHLALHRYFTVYPLFTLCYTLPLCHLLIFKRHNFTFNFHWRGYEHYCHVENLLFVFCFFFLILSSWFTILDSCREQREVHTVPFEGAWTRDVPGYKCSFLFQRAIS